MGMPRGMSETPSNAPASPVEMLCDAQRVLQCLRAGSAWLEAHVAQVNALNVFPVPDGDTGTNMSLTMRAALEEAATCQGVAVSDLVHAVSHGALMGARGNSGVILSQILRGLARSLSGKERMAARDLAEALREGAATAYKGVMKPGEGTMLTVIRESAEAAARAAEQGGSLEKVLVSAKSEADASLARTPQLLPVLAHAGVVDAGGQGLVYILEGIVRLLQGQTTEALISAEAHVEHAHAPDGQYNYDTQFIISGDTLDVETIRERIAQMGDSVLVVGDERAVKVHVHADHPGEVLEYGITQGQVSAVIIENMQLQYQEFLARKQQSPMQVSPVALHVAASELAEQTCNISVIAVASGDGLKRVFESLGVSAIVPGGQTMNPSTQDLLQAIEAVPCDQVILLPNNSNIILTAEQARQLSHKQVLVVPTKTVPQGIAALLAFNYQSDLATNAAVMTAASRQVQTAEITRAVRSVQVNGLSVVEGQIIGLLNGDLKTAGETALDVVQELLDQMDAGQCEIITIYYGEDMTSLEADGLAEAVRKRYPEVEVEVLDGGQAHYYYIISAE